MGPRKAIAMSSSKGDIEPLTVTSCRGVGDARRTGKAVVPRELHHEERCGVTLQKTEKCLDSPHRVVFGEKCVHRIPLRGFEILKDIHRGTDLLHTGSIFVCTGHPLSGLHGNNLLVCAAATEVADNDVRYFGRSGVHVTESDALSWNCGAKQVSILHH